MEEFKGDPSHYKGIHPWVFAITMICVAIVSAVATYYMGGADKLSHYATTSQEETSTLPSGAIEQISKVYELLKDQYVDATITEEQLINGALKGMAESVGDPYTSYMIGQETSSTDELQTGSFGGIGAELKTENGQVVISTVMEGYPAQQVGLQSGDIIYKVDGVDMTGKTVSEVVFSVRGEAGTTVVLTIIRSGEELEVTATRAQISITTVKGSLDTQFPHIGYVQITSFAANTATELETIITDLRNQGATSFVFDLRNNPGGLLTQAILISNMFLEDGKPILHVEDRNGSIRTYNASKKYGTFKISEPYVVLVNENSASASEIFASALKESAAATIIGTTTYGKGTVQSIVSVTDVNELKYTTAKWLTASKEWIHQKGVTPTMEVSLPAYSYLTIIDAREPLVLGSISSSVKSTEVILEALGYAVQADGYYDEKTVEAVKAYQADKQLSVTGEVDTQTATSLIQDIRVLIDQQDTQYNAATQYLTAQ